jgi:chromosomal replication initiator protein
MQRAPLTFARFVAGPENRRALVAVQDVAAALCARRPCRNSPLVLHGPAGTGKTHLVSALIEEATRRCPDLVIALLSASELGSPAAGGERNEDRRSKIEDRGSRIERQKGTPDRSQSSILGPPSSILSDPLEAARQSDLIVVEDLQHLPPHAVEPLVQLLDYLGARRRQVVATALVGPQELAYRGVRFPARLTSRLAGGLVVGLEPLRAESRLALLQDKAQRRQLAVSPDVLGWLAEHLTGGGRQLEGALSRLEALARLEPRPLDVAGVARHFQEQAEASRVTLEQIAQRVSRYFRVGAGLLLSRRRSRNVVVPRQVGMYLARCLTALSLEQIGAYFGRRDHSTVLHACRKVEGALGQDPVLSGAVRQLQADFG